MKLSEKVISIHEEVDPRFTRLKKFRGQGAAITYSKKLQDEGHPINDIFFGKSRMYWVVALKKKKNAPDSRDKSEAVGDAIPKDKLAKLKSAAKSKIDAIQGQLDKLKPQIKKVEDQHKKEVATATKFNDKRADMRKKAEDLLDSGNKDQSEKIRDQIEKMKPELLSLYDIASKTRDTGIKLRGERDKLLKKLEMIKDRY